MFTGIIEELGKIRKITRNGSNAVADIACSKVSEDVSLGDSIAVNGVCLTVTSFNSLGFTADVSEETLRRTSLKAATPGAVVNLERAMKMGGRFGGHIVQGHVDCMGTLLSSNRSGEFWVLSFNLPTEIRKYVSEKGSITIDGISLTVAKDQGDSFTVAVIPHTYSGTNLYTLKSGSNVNLEVDVIARYIDKLMNSKDTEGKLKNILMNME